MEIKYMIEKIATDYLYTDDKGNSSITIAASELDPIEPADDEEEEIELRGLPPEIAKQVSVGDLILITIPFHASTGEK